jgi:peptidoglycan hydrolase-like protein with peptidoglycan-binding domain
MIKIKQFQLQYGLVDGVIGKKTLNKIKQVLNIPSNQALAHLDKLHTKLQILI